MMRQTRIDLGLSQSHLAGLLRIRDKRAISRIETGEQDCSGPVSLIMDLLRTSTVTVEQIEAINSRD